MAHIGRVSATFTTTGSDGSATGSGALPSFSGFLLDFFFDHSAGQAATTDVTIAHPVFGNVLVASNSATDTYYPVLVNAKDATGTAISGVYVNLPVDDALTVSIAQADNNETTTVYARFIVP